MKMFAKLVLGASLVALAVPASAAEWLDFTASGTASGAGRVYADGKVKVSATAWSIDSSSAVKQSSLGRYSQGLGVSFSGDNSHTVDNMGRRDFIVLQFDQNVVLDSGEFRTGWHGMNDTDAQIGFANMSQSFTTQPGFNGKAATVALAGFQTWSSGSVGKSGNSIRGINSAGHNGNTWLIGAGLAGSPDAFPDGFKLKGVSYTMAPTAVPEPSTWAMMLLGFGAVGAAVRRRTARQNLAYA